MKKKSIIVVLLMCIYYNTSGQLNFVAGKQLGTVHDDVPSYLVTDSLNNVYVFGTSAGLLGEKQHGEKDGVICKFDDTGKLLWTKQCGSGFDDEFIQAAFDKNGNIVVVGYYSIAENNKDVWVLKFNTSGDILWENTIGTDSIDIGWNIAINDENSIYIIGHTKGELGEDINGDFDCFILQLNSKGVKQKAVQFGSDREERGYGITIGADSQIYVCGATFGDLVQKSLGKSDAFWGVFSKELEQRKMIQFGTDNYDLLHLIQADKEQNIVIGGTTGGKIGTQQYGHMDAYLQKMDKNGSLLWQKQFGTKKGDYVNGITFTKNLDVLISGCQNWSDCQAFCRLYSKDGELLWKNNYIAMGKEHGTCGKGICINSQGYIYHTGSTGGALFSDTEGGYDFYYLKLKLDIEQ